VARLQEHGREIAQPEGRKDREMLAVYLLGYVDIRIDQADFDSGAAFRVRINSKLNITYLDIAGKNGRRVNRLRSLRRDPIS
jgi:hypothetical protein